MFSRVPHELSVEGLGPLPVEVQHFRHEPRLEEGGCGDETGGRAVAAPSPVLRWADESGTDGIQYDVQADLDRVRLGLDERGGERAGEQMAESSMAAVELVRVATQEPPHPGAEGWLGCLDDRVEVRVHQTVGVDAPAGSPRRAPQTGDERLPVVVVDDDTPASVTAGDDVVDRPSSFGPSLARHRCEGGATSARAPDGLPGLVPAVEATLEAGSG
jgi:hypothetical protein